MKKLAFLLLLASQISFSQSYDEQNVFFEINAGVADDANEISFVNNNNFDIKSLYNNQISYFEIGFSNTDLSSLPNYYLKTAGSMTFKYFYPIYSTDSIRKKYSGNLLGFDLGGINFFPNTSFIDFVISGGLNMGSKKVRINRDVKYKNFIFAPRATAQLRIIFSDEFGFNFKAEGQYDVTKDRWKLKKGENVLPNLKGFKYNPLMLSAGISFKFL